MKRILSYLTVMLFLVSCGGHADVVEPPFSFDDNLLYIDSLMQRSPDSALQTLLSFRAERGTSFDFNNNYQSLLISEALYKTDNAQLNRYRNETFQETSLQDAIHCFDSLAAQYPGNDDFTLLSARSHYMNGVGFYENDSVVEACKEYLHTLEIMEDHFDTEKLIGYKAKFIGLTYTRLGEVFSHSFVAKPAINSYKQAIWYFLKLPDYSLANTYRALGLSYQLDNNKDTALYYYRKAICLARKQNKLSIYCGTLAEVSTLYHELNYKDSAFMMIKEALSLPCNKDVRLAQYHALGYLYYKESLYDSAIVYLNQSIKRNSYTTQTASAELLMNCYKTLGDTIKASYYKDIYGNNFSQYRNNAEITTDLTKLYDDYQQQRHDKDNLLKRKHQYRIYSIVISNVLLLIVSIIVIFKIKMRKMIYKSNYDLSIKEKALADMRRKFGTNPFINESICNYIWKIVTENNFKAKIDYKVYKDYALNKNQLMMLRDAVDRHYDNFTQILGKQYPELTVDDIDYCCLYLIGLKDADISALIQRAYPTVHQRSNKLKHIFNAKESLQSTISSMASELHSNM